MRPATTFTAVLPFIAALARAHGDHAEIDENSDYTYAELHMAQEVISFRGSRPLANAS